MKRPLAVVGFTLLISMVVLCIFSSVSLALITALVSYVAFMITSFIDETRKRLTLPTVFFVIMVACVMFYCAE